MCRDISPGEWKFPGIDIPLFKKLFCMYSLIFLFYAIFFVGYKYIAFCEKLKSGLKRKKRCETHSLPSETYFQVGETRQAHVNCFIHHYIPGN